MLCSQQALKDALQIIDEVSMDISSQPTPLPESSSATSTRDSSNKLVKMGVAAVVGYMAGAITNIFLECK